MKTLHAQQVLGRQLSDALSIRYIYACTGVPLGRFNTLIEAADKKEDFEHLFLNDLTPAQPGARYEYIQSLAFPGYATDILVRK